MSHEMPNTTKIAIIRRHFLSHGIRFAIDYRIPQRKFSEIIPLSEQAQKLKANDKEYKTAQRKKPSIHLVATKIVALLISVGFLAIQLWKIDFQAGTSLVVAWATAINSSKS